MINKLKKIFCNIKTNRKLNKTLSFISVEPLISRKILKIKNIRNKKIDELTKYTSVEIIDNIESKSKLTENKIILKITFPSKKLNTENKKININKLEKRLKIKCI